MHTHSRINTYIYIRCLHAYCNYCKLNKNQFFFKISQMLRMEMKRFVESLGRCCGPIRTGTLWTTRWWRWSLADSASWPSRTQRTAGCRPAQPIVVYPTVHTQPTVFLNPSTIISFECTVYCMYVYAYFELSLYFSCSIGHIKPARIHSRSSATAAWRVTVTGNLVYMYP